MTDNRTTELLPCPFCGGEASVKVLEYDDDCKVWGVFCESDLECEYSHGHFVDNYPIEAEAIAAWNTRAELGSGTCEYCKDGTFDGQTVMMSNHGWQVINYCPNCGAKVVGE